MNTAVGIALDDACLRYQSASQPVLAKLAVTFPAGKWSCVLGQSGCGKTTLLRYLAGLLDGQAEFTGKLQISDGKPLAGRIAYMAQQDLLMPWLSVLDNVCLATRFGPNSGAVTEAECKRALTLLEQVGLADQAEELPQQLSGGMRQRVALARTLMQDKPVVLMDEPFSALDAVTRHKLQDLAAKLLQDRTVVLITHDPQEALRLGHRLYVLQGSPAKAVELSVPSGTMPRNLGAELGEHQQRILALLGAVDVAVAEGEVNHD